MLPEKYTNVKLLIVGDGPEKDDLISMSEKLKLNGKVQFLGHRNDVNELLQASDIFISITETEGLSCTIIEALSAGLPVIISNIGGNNEIITHRTEGFLVNVGRLNIAKEILNKLIDEHELRKKMGKKSRDRAIKLFSIEKMTQEYAKLYENVLN